MLSPTDRFRENLRSSAQIKLEPEMWFSSGLASFIRHLASYEQLHPDAMCICLLNVVAICCGNSFILRRGNSYISLNLYNFIIAKSGYGKSDILSKVERAVKQCASFHKENFMTASSRQTIIASNEPEEASKKVPRVIFNDGTGAGILSQLDSCTRALCLHETDTTMTSWNVMQNGPLDRTMTRIDSFRSTLMTLYEDPGSFTRLLKNELINTEGSKLILLGASTGELIISQLGRIAGHQMADALFERITLFPLEGDPIANDDCLPQIDFTRYPSLEQFGMICGFINNVKLKLDDNGDFELARLTLEMKKASNAESTNDHLASRLAKTSQLIYRFAGLFCLLECAIEITEKYLSEIGSFGNGQCDVQLFNRIGAIVEETYGFIFIQSINQHLIVDESIAQRARDVVLANLEQYKLLLHVDEDDGRHWNIVPGGQSKFFSLFPLNAEKVSNGERRYTSADCEKPKRRIINLLKKSNPLKVHILLHDSIIFVKSGLYTDWRLKSAASIIDKTLLSELVNEGLLMSINNGIIGEFNKPTVYIKTIPGGTVSVEDLERMLAFYDDDRLIIGNYLDKCKNVKLEGCGTISQEVFDVFNRPEYKSMQLDLSSLINLKQGNKNRVKQLLGSDSIILGQVSNKDNSHGNISSQITSTQSVDESVNRAGGDLGSEDGAGVPDDTASIDSSTHSGMVTNFSDDVEYDGSLPCSSIVQPRTTIDFVVDSAQVVITKQKRKTEARRPCTKKSKNSDGSTGDCPVMDGNQGIFHDLIGANLRPRRTTKTYR